MNNLSIFFYILIHQCNESSATFFQKINQQIPWVEVFFRRMFFSDVMRYLIFCDIYVAFLKYLSNVIWNRNPKLSKIVYFAAWTERAQSLLVESFTPSFRLPHSSAATSPSRRSWRLRSTIIQRAPLARCATASYSHIRAICLKTTSASCSIPPSHHVFEM